MTVGKGRSGWKITHVEILNLHEKCSGLFRVVIIFMIMGYIGLAQAFEISQLQWAPGVSDKLQRGEVFTYKEYSVEAVMYPAPVESDRYRDVPEEPVDPYVGLNISKNGNFIETVVLQEQDSYIVPDGELKITATQLPSTTATEWLYESYAPWAIIELSPRGTPDLKVSIDADSSSATEIVATVQLENTGSADANNVSMRIETELPATKGSLEYHYARVKKDESITETITLSKPLLLEQKEYGILVNASGYDAKDIYYTSEDQTVVTVVPESLSIRKNANNKIYLKDYAMISLSLKNNGKVDLKNVSISDSLPESFKLVGNRTLHWVADIPAGRDWDFRYLVKPREANKDGIVFPSATAEFEINKEFYSIRSNQPKIKVNGPKIVLTKQANISGIEPNQTITALTVTVTAENDGNTPTKVFMKDILPENATIVSGNTTYEGFLEANRTVSYNYSIMFDTVPSIRFPPATADYYELGTRGEKMSTASKELEIGIIPTPAPANVSVPPANESDNSTSYIKILGEP